MKKLYTEFDLNQKQWEYFKSIIPYSLLVALNQGYAEFSDIYNALTDDERFLLNRKGDN